MGIMRALAKFGRDTGFDALGGFIFKARRVHDNVADIQEAEAHVPQVDAARRVIRGHRSVHMAYTSDGKLHLRRRARQIRREFGRGVSLMALPKDDHGLHISDAAKNRWKPWWWF